MSYKGKLVRVDLGTGGWVLETKDGDRIALMGEVPAALQDREVVVEGSTVDGASFLMTGSKMVQVKAVREA